MPKPCGILRFSEYKSETPKRDLRRNSHKCRRRRGGGTERDRGAMWIQRRENFYMQTLSNGVSISPGQEEWGLKVRLLKQATK